MTTTQPLSAATIPGYLAGTWQIDTVHSDVAFSVRHMMVSKVRGSFTDSPARSSPASSRWTPASPPRSSSTSIDTRNEQRDNHIRSADFFDVETYPR